jgi:hypothetical protein
MQIKGQQLMSLDLRQVGRDAAQTEVAWRHTAILPSGDFCCSLSEPPLTSEPPFTGKELTMPI